MWQQEQLLQQHWGAMDPYGGRDRQGSQVPYDAADCGDVQPMSSRILPPSVLSATHTAATAPAPAQQAQEVAARELMPREPRATKVDGERTRKIRVGKDEREEEKVQATERREKREKEQQGRNDEGEDEWEVIKRPDGVLVDDCVDSDDSDTWC